MIKIYIIKYKNDPIYVGATKGRIHDVMVYYFDRIINEYDKDLCSVELLEEVDNRLARNFWIRHFIDKGYKLLNKYTGYDISEYEGVCETNNQRYHHSKEGRVRLKQAQERYRQTDRYRAYQKKYRICDLCYRFY